MEINNPQKNLNINENTISTKRYQLFDNLDETSLIKEKNNSKISLRKKKNSEYITKIRKGKIKKLELYLNLNNAINYDELLKEIPKEIISEFASTKNKYSFFIKYLSLTEKDDPNFYIRMFVIYQIHILSYNDITNSSLPSKELLDWLIKYLLFYEYNNDQMHKKIQIQSEIIQMLIIWVSYIQEDNSNSVLYDDHFIFQLMDLIDSNIYNVEFKINILQLFNVMIKGTNTFNKIMIKFELINKIEKTLSLIIKDDQYIFILRLIFKIFDYLSDEDEEMKNTDNKENASKIIVFKNSYNNLILLFNHYYEEYQKRYDELKNSKTPISLDSKSRICYKIIIKLLKIINFSLYVEGNIFYICILINNQSSILLFLKILETFSKEFFISDNEIKDNDLSMEINNNILLKYQPSLKIKENNNIYKKFKTIKYITFILTEIISFSLDNNSFQNYNETYNIIMNMITKFNLINYYANLIKNLICFNIKPDNLLILRIEEFIYNFCEVDKNNYIIVYKNYDLIRELLFINEKYFNSDNFDLIIKFIYNSISLYETEITRSLIFEIKIISFFMKFLRNELGNNKKKYKNINYIIYVLKEIISSNTYRKCQLNRSLIIHEFNKNNATKILEEYAIKISDSDYYLISDLLNNLDETDLLDSEQLEDLYN